MWAILNPERVSVSQKCDEGWDHRSHFQRGGNGPPHLLSKWLGVVTAAGGDTITEWQGLEGPLWVIWTHSRGLTLSPSSKSVVLHFFQAGNPYFHLTISMSFLAFYFESILKVRTKPPFRVFVRDLSGWYQHLTVKTVVCHGRAASSAETC